MLQIAPDDETSSADGTDDPIFCANCGHLLTRDRWAIDLDGHERVFINPAGHVFRIRLFNDAPGVGIHGDLTTDFSWFPGYGWQFAHCHGCHAQVGWYFAGGETPREFYGFIKTALTTHPTGDQA